MISPILLVALAACGGSDPSDAAGPTAGSGKGERAFSLVYSNNVNGDIEPCG